MIIKTKQNVNRPKKQLTGLHLPPWTGSPISGFGLDLLTHLDVTTQGTAVMSKTLMDQRS